MIDPASFVAGWICCGLFIVAGYSIQRLVRRRRAAFATTSQFLDDFDEAELQLGAMR